MENASKALIMAGGVLIALMLLAAFVYIFGQMGQNANEQDREKLMEQISEFNKSYESYQRNLLRGADVVSVCNKANDYNIQYKNTTVGSTNTNEEIHIYVTFTVGNWQEFKKNTSYDMTEYFKNLIKNNKEKFNEFKEKYFKCTKMDYNTVTGKVNKMYFQEVDGAQLLVKD